MLSAQRGFTLLETLIAMALSSVVLLGASRLFPVLQMEIMREYQYVAKQEAMWQLAFSVGKNLRRAGYCRGACQGEGLRILNGGSCVLVQWDANGNGKWDVSPEGQSELTGYRLRNESLETQKGAKSCEGNGWEKMSDPELMSLQHFSVTRQNRKEAKPLLSLRLAASLGNRSRISEINYIVSGENL